jgi:4-amino-4-deoxy-L-arabinose transferase-like glycosyltransferase
MTGEPRAESDNRDKPSLLPAPSREVALAALLLLATLVARLAGLGRWALTDRELAGAVSALGWLRGEQVTGLAYSPLQWLWQAPLFALTRSGEWAARLPSALAGVALAALVYGQRRILGRARALALMGLLLVSPTLLHLGRQADGAFLGAGAALAATLLGARALAEGQPRDWRWFAIAVAVGLTAGAGFWTWVLALIVALAWCRWRSGQRPLLQEDHRRDAVAQAWIWGAAALAGIATAGLTHLAGLGGVIELAGAWFAGFARSVDPWHLPLLNLVLYEPLLLALGIVGAVQAVRQRERLGLFALWWFILALVLALAGHRSAYWQADLVMPLALLAASGVAPCWAALRAGQGAPTTVAWACLAVLLAFGFMNLAMFGHTNQAPFAWLAAGAAIMIAGLWAGFWLWEGPEAAFAVGAALLLTVLGAVTVRSAVALGYQTARDPREPLVYDPVALSPQRWSEMLGSASLNAAGDQRTLDVVWAPALDLQARWYLREMHDAQPMTPDNWANAAALLAPVSSNETAPAGYVGQRLTYRETWMGEGLLASDWLRWLLWREPVGWEEAESIALWYRFER